MEWMRHILFIHSPVDEHVGGFHFLAVMNGAVVDIRSKFFVWMNVLISLGFICRSGILRLRKLCV